MQRAPPGAAQTHQPSIVRRVGATYLIGATYLQRNIVGATYLGQEWEEGLGIEHPVVICCYYYWYCCCWYCCCCCCNYYYYYYCCCCCCCCCCCYYYYYCHLLLPRLLRRFSATTLLCGRAVEATTLHLPTSENTVPSFSHVLTPPPRMDSLQ